ncbi:hypothetical protein [Desulfovibrio cuneatus]|uniref:hypothetical protein n=1 Tax=Desulfovibrio cuneatus TaxID=159728 RepID=UPI0004826697|nr:hypothetical protein [Desulfovibrio cuneatus]
MTENTRKLFHRISLLSDVDAFPLTVKLLADELKNIDAQSAQMLTADQRPVFTVRHWDHLMHSVALALTPDYLTLAGEMYSDDSLAPTQATPSRYMYKLYNFCRERQKRLDHIALTVTPKAMRYVPQLTNIDITSLPSVLRNYAKQHNITDGCKKFPEVKSASQVLQYVSQMREHIIQRDMGAAFNDKSVMAQLDELEALYGVLLYYFNDVQKRELRVSPSLWAFPHYVYCEKCWHLIPESYVNRHSQRCDAHSLCMAPSTATRKAKIVHDALTASNPVFSRDVEKKLAALNDAWKPQFGNTSHDGWLVALETLQSNNLPNVTYDLTQVWETCPHTRDYLLKKGVCITDVDSVLMALSPSLAGETQEERQQRKALHAILCKNFWLFRIDLALAETWLSHYQQQYGNRTHGGARANTGGKRIGAGRPRKAK